MNFVKYLFLGLFLSSQAHAYLSIAESAEMLSPGKFQVGAEAQFLTNRGGGTNANVFVDTTLNDSTSARITMGAGSVDFNAFASVKWVPFPDFENQPAMGLRAGLGLARDADQNITLAQIAPIVSKRFATDYGPAVPYLAVPFTALNTKEENYISTNLAIGSEFKYFEWENVNLGGELGIELNKSYSYISLYVSFPFESSKGFGN